MWDLGLLTIQVFRDVMLYRMGKRLPTFPGTQYHIPEHLNPPYSSSQCTVTDLKQLHASSVHSHDYVQYISRPPFNLQGKTVSSHYRYQNLKSQFVVPEIKAPIFFSSKLSIICFPTYPFTTTKSFYTLAKPAGIWCVSSGFITTLSIAKVDECVSCIGEMILTRKNGTTREKPVPVTQISTVAQNGIT
jgi:hypothetical protein